MDELIKDILVEDIFNDKYIIPLYQRAYSWEKKEIVKLIEDISDFDADKYYLGTLIVHKRENEYEVIDGQQRLTTLYMISKILEKDCNDSLVFECRPKSNYTLSKFMDETIEESLIDESIKSNKKFIENIFNNINFDKEQFLNNLKQTHIYRIEVPKNTDLNRYFEIINTRGEQLEQTDILKSKLMSYLSNEIERQSFASIWDACKDMTGYVQMHFTVAERDELFGTRWDYLSDEPFKKMLEIKRKKKSKKEKNIGCSISKIISKDYKIEEQDYDKNNIRRVRFESIIDFPYFLLHVLKILVDVKDYKNIDSEKKLYKEQLDDKKLLESFEYVINNTENINNRKFVIDYIECLLKCRFLFDKYIIKREYSKDDIDGDWSLKTLIVYGKNTKRKANYELTEFRRKNSKYNKKTQEEINKENLMIQSCLRVSYISQKIMHWITITLKDLYEKNNDYERANIFNTTFEIAKSAVKKDYLDNNNYNLGVKTPHLVFNFLDFILWRKNKDIYEDFKFDFSNSVEHWYPQNPVDGVKMINCDRLGNLCIIQRKINSKFSNLPPESKRNTYKKDVTEGSIKLRIMAKLTESNREWNETLCEIHENEMIKLLEENCK